MCQSGKDRAGDTTDCGTGDCPARGRSLRTLEDAPGLCLRKLEPAHARELSALETRIFRHGWQASQMEEALSSPRTHWGFGFFLASKDVPGHDEPHGESPGEARGKFRTGARGGSVGGDRHGDVGDLCAYILMNSALDECEVANIAVREDLRGRGLGGQLLDRALQEARDRNISNCFLEVASANPVARSLYVSRGFTEVGKRKGYYSETGDDAIVMRLDL